MGNGQGAHAARAVGAGYTDSYASMANIELAKVRVVAATGGSGLGTARVCNPDPES